MPWRVSSVLVCLALAIPQDRGIQVGYCTALANLTAAKSAGFDYLELSTTEITALSDADFELAMRRIAEVGLPTPAANLFLSATLKVTGPDVNREQQTAYVRKGLRSSVAHRYRSGRLRQRRRGRAAPWSR